VTRLASSGWHARTELSAGLVQAYDDFVRKAGAHE
jgi:hypothetical protein